MSEYYHVLRIADGWICDEVIRIIEKAVENTLCSSVNKEKLRMKFNLANSKQMPLAESTLKRESKDKTSDWRSQADAKKSRVDKND